MMNRKFKRLFEIETYYVTGVERVSSPKNENYVINDSLTLMSSQAYHTSVHLHNTV